MVRERAPWLSLARADLRRGLDTLPARLYSPARAAIVVPAPVIHSQVRQREPACRGGVFSLWDLGVYAKQTG